MPLPRDTSEANSVRAAAPHENVASMLALIGLFSSVGQVSALFPCVLYSFLSLVISLAGLQQLVPTLECTCHSMLICNLLLGYWSGYISGNLYKHIPRCLGCRATWQCNFECRALWKPDNTTSVSHRLA